MYDTIHLTNFLLFCACAGRQIGNSLDDSAPAEDSPLGSEKSCTVKSQAAQEMLEMQGNQSPRGAPRAAAESFSEVNGEGSKVTPKTLHFYIGDGTDVSDVPFDVSTFFLFGNLFGHRSKGHSFAVLRATALAPAEFEALVDALEILKKARIETTFNPQRASVTSIMALVAKTAGDRCSLQCLRFGGDHGHHTFAKNVPEGRGFLVNARRGASLRCCACANCPGPRQTCDGCGKNFHFHPENFYIAEKSIEFALCETCSTGSPEPWACSWRPGRIHYFGCIQCVHRLHSCRFVQIFRFSDYLIIWFSCALQKFRSGPSHGSRRSARGLHFAASSR